MAASNADKVLAGAVFGYLTGHNFRDGNNEGLSQHRTVIFGQVGHVSEVANTPVIDPLPNLADPHLGLLFGRARGDQGVAHRVACHTDKVRQSFHGFAWNG